LMLLENRATVPAHSQHSIDAALMYATAGCLSSGSLIQH
jgi:hypothetical protein